MADYPFERFRLFIAEPDAPDVPNMDATGVVTIPTGYTELLRVMGTFSINETSDTTEVTDINGDVVGNPSTKTTVTSKQTTGDMSPLTAELYFKTKPDTNGNVHVDAGKSGKKCKLLALGVDTSGVPLGVFAADAQVTAKEDFTWDKAQAILQFPFTTSFRRVASRSSHYTVMTPLFATPVDATP